MIDQDFQKALAGTGIGYRDLTKQMPDDPKRAWWAKPQAKEDIDTYVIHHSAGAAYGDPMQIYKQHYSQWGGGGYHFMVHCYMSNLGIIKSIYRTRDLLTWGAHVAGKNDNKIGVCWLGSYHAVVPSGYVLSASREIFAIIRDVLNDWSGNNNKFVAHRHLAATVCPGSEWVEPFLVEVNTNNTGWKAGYNRAILDIQRMLDELEIDDG